MHNIKFMQVHNSFHDISYNKGTLKLVKKLSSLHVLIQILAINILSDDIFMSFRVDCINIF